MITWSFETKHVDIVETLNKALLTSVEDTLQIKITKLPKFCETRISLILFKTQLDRYPKKITFETPNPIVFKALKSAGMEVVMTNKKDDFWFKNIESATEVIEEKKNTVDNNGLKTVIKKTPLELIKASYTNEKKFFKVTTSGEALLYNNTDLVIEESKPIPNNIIMSVKHLLINTVVEKTESIEVTPVETANNPIFEDIKDMPSQEGIIDTLDIKPSNGISVKSKKVTDSRFNKLKSSKTNINISGAIKKETNKGHGIVTNKSATKKSRQEPRVGFDTNKDVQNRLKVRAQQLPAVLVVREKIVISSNLSKSIKISNLEPIVNPEISDHIQFEVKSFKANSELTSQGHNVANDSFESINNSFLFQDAIENDFDQMLSSISNIKTELKSKKSVKKNLLDSTFFINTRSLHLVGVLSLLTVFLVSLFNFTPAYAFNVEVDNKIIERTENIKLSKQTQESKTIDISAHMEKVIPKEKRESLVKAKGSVILFSKGGNSCTITNGGFLVANESKRYTVEYNTNYSQSIVIPANSIDTSTITLNVESELEGDGNNLERGQVLTLETLSGDNLSKNCFAKVTEPVLNYRMVANNEVTLDNMTTLKDQISESIKNDVNKELEKMRSQGYLVSPDYYQLKDASDFVNNKIGDKADTLAITRNQKLTIPFIQKNTLIETVNNKLSKEKIASDFEIVSIDATDIDLNMYSVKYNEVNRPVDMEKIKLVLNSVKEYNEATKSSIEAKIQSEYPQVKSISKTTDGVNIPVFKKININIVKN